MTLSASLRDLRDLLEGVETQQGPRFRHGRTDDEDEGRFADRVFFLNLISRLGPADTGIQPRVLYTAEVRLQHAPGGVDDFADMERLANESATLARTIEESSLEMLVEPVTFERTTETHVATIPVRILVRE